MNKFELKDGQLSRYAFLCGYIQERKTATKHVILFQDGDYQIEAWDVNNPYNRIYRKSFDYNISEARKEFKRLCK